MADNKPKYYAIRNGRRTGIVRTWAECEAAIKGFSGAVYRKFEDEKSALLWLSGDEGLMAANGVQKKPEECWPENFREGFQADYDVYTDGSFSGGQYSWAYAFVQDGQVVYEDSATGKNPEAAVMRNVAGELAAVLYAVKRASELGVRIRVHHDYEGVAHWVNGAWKAKNELTQSYVEIMHKYKGIYEFTKVLAHSGNEFNDYVDKKAKEALGIDS